MSHHIPDVTKMISDTPRMKAAQMTAIEHMTGDVYRVGCDIEQQLNTANVEIEEKRKDIVYLATEKVKLEERIKRLEEALDLVRPHCSFVHHSKKHQHAYDEPCPVVALIEKAKEAKP